MLYNLVFPRRILFSTEERRLKLEFIYENGKTNYEKHLPSSRDRRVEPMNKGMKAREVLS